MTVTHSLAILLLTATSFSTVRSSNVWGVNASFLRVLLQIGHGAGPRVNNLSIQDSHLQTPDVRTSKHVKVRDENCTFYGNKS